MNAKINFLHALMKEMHQKKILFVDMDTIFSSMIQSDILKLDTNGSFNLEMMMPLQTMNHLFTVLKRLFDSLSNDTVIMLDSLNGLIDYLNIYQAPGKNGLGLDGINKIKKRTKHKVGGYKSINILFLLLKRTQCKKVPIVITIFQRKETSEKIQASLMADNQDLGFNHLVRISNRMFFLDYLNDGCNDGRDRTTFTVFNKDNKNALGNFYPRSLCC
jgi:hypothetical protein